MIEINDVTKLYDNNEVIKGLSLTIQDKEIHGIVGKSGAGKSTLLRMINGLEKFDHGEIKVNEQNISNMSERELRDIRKNIGIIFQNFALLNRKNVYENIAFPMKCWNYENDKIEERVRNLLEVVDLEDKINSMPLNLSGGQRQRVAIARALTLDPSILLSDESTSGLDPITTNNILNLLLDINEKFGITMVVVTHEMDVIKKICDRISILEEGRIVATGKVEDLLLNFNPYLTKYMQSVRFDCKHDELIARILIYSQKGKENKFLLEASKNLEYILEKANVDNLKNGKLEEYYLKVDIKNKAHLVRMLDNYENLSYRFID